jgi:hypothetical protein
MAFLCVYVSNDRSSPKVSRIQVVKRNWLQIVQKGIKRKGTHILLRILPPAWPPVSGWSWHWSLTRKPDPQRHWLDRLAPPVDWRMGLSSPMSSSNQREDYSSVRTYARHGPIEFGSREHASPDAPHDLFRIYLNGARRVERSSD